MSQNTGYTKLREYITAQSKKWQMPELHIAASELLPEQEDLMKEYISSAEDVNAVAADKTTALHHAAMNGMNKNIELLLANGAAPNLQDIHGSTPLSLVLFKPEAFEILVQSGKIDFSIKNIYGQTILEEATSSGLRACVDILVKAGVTLANNADPYEILKQAEGKLKSKAEEPAEQEEADLDMIQPKLQLDEETETDHDDPRQEEMNFTGVAHQHDE